METMKFDLKELDSLPPLPVTVTKLVSAVSRNDVEVGEIEEIILQDEALASRIVKAANSSRFATKEKVATIPDCINRIGFKTIKEIAVCQHCSELMDKPLEGYGLLRGQLWKGSLSGARASELLARRSRLVDSSYALIAGLLRDIGKIAMVQLFPEEKLREAFVRKTPGLDQIGREREAFGIDHPELGAELAMRWGFPQRLAQAIRFHHEPPWDPNLQDSLFDTVHAGDMVAMSMGLGAGLDGMEYTVSEEVCRRLDLTTADIEEIMSEVQTFMTETLPENDPEKDGPMGGLK